MSWAVLIAGVGRWWRLGLVVALILAGGWLYLKGRADGAAAVEARLASDRIKIIQDGKEIDLETLTLDDDGLCRVLGGCGVSDGADRDTAR